MKDTVLKYLEKYSIFRNRSEKNKGLVIILQHKYPVLQQIEKKVLLDVFEDLMLGERYWRKILQETPSLRGSDYDEKDAIEKIVQQELGYNVK